MLLDGGRTGRAFDAQVTKAAETEDPAEFQRILEPPAEEWRPRRLATLGNRGVRANTLGGGKPRHEKGPRERRRR